VGLLSPSHRTGAGYREYTEEDLRTLQQILALKFLGFTLEEIKQCLRKSPSELREVLARQKSMMAARRDQLSAVIRALEEAESLVRKGHDNGDSIVKVIQALQMDQKNEWIKSYFTEDQLRKMEELSNASYSNAARQKLKERGGEWTEEDQKRAQEQWAYVAREADRLAEAGADPAGPEAQAVAKVKHDLLSAFTQGDPEVASGLNRFWEGFNALPDGEKPFDASPFQSGGEGTDLLNRALAIYREKLPA
jgi:DNA-binding transcriptional MerR regulator